jgi:hypothetical protein
MQMLGRGIPKENVREIFDRVSFIVFNYDRCLEHFLKNALEMTYKIRPDEASSIIAKLHIIHPYGVVDEAVGFGTTRGDYVKLAEGIKTYTEQIAAADVVKAIAVEVSRAECIVFLGYGYHSQNMQLLRPADPMPELKPVFGTAHGLSDADVEVVSHQINNWFSKSAIRSGSLRLENKLTCAGLFDDYAKSLTGGD